MVAELPYGEVGEVGERRPAPQRERLAQSRRRGRVVAGVDGRAALRVELLEAVGVQLPGSTRST